jgi:hypothetical protein
MKPAPLSYLMTVPTAALIAAIMVLRDLDLPVLWSTAIGFGLWSWLILMLWALRFPSPPETANRDRARHFALHRTKPE